MHAGGHALGSGSDILYKPDGLVNQAMADGQPLIWVAFNYRLGCKRLLGMQSVRRMRKKSLTELAQVFGFATSKAMIDTKHTNAGLRDQRAALECTPNPKNFMYEYRLITWRLGVRDNIEAFGGDPDKGKQR